MSSKNYQKTKPQTLLNQSELNIPQLFHPIDLILRTIARIAIAVFGLPSVNVAPNHPS